MTLTAASPEPLMAPLGLAVAPNGNLYVANALGNNILVYSPAHNQLASETITAGISIPSGVAFDSRGNLWVANAGNNSITKYVPNGVQGSVETINGVFNPQAIAIDALDDLWVNNGDESLSMYPLVNFGFTAPMDALPGFPSTSFPGRYIQPFTGPASGAGYIVFGSNVSGGVFPVFAALSALGQNELFVVGRPLSPGSCIAAAFDSAGDLYCANEDSSLTFYPVSGFFSTHTTLVANMPGFSGMAIDNARGFIYVSNAKQNSIAVYNTRGKLLTTITD